MGVNVDTLTRYRGYEDPSAGISEEFLQPRLGLGRTVAILARPLGPARPVGFVICHSFAMEQIHLTRFDAFMARSLAAAGFPVLRFHGRGYGDSEGDMSDIGLSSHLAEATDVVALMAAQDHVDEVGIMGARVGGMVAALVADAQNLPYLALWDPVVAGAQYMRDFLRSQLLHKMVQDAAQAGLGQASDESPGSTQGSGVGDPRRQLETVGRADIKGFPLTRQAFDDFSAVNLARDLQQFRGKSLVLGLSRTERMSPSLTKLEAHLQELGGECTAQVVIDKSASQFGQHHHSNLPGGIKVDLQFQLTRALAELTAAWATGEPRRATPHDQSRQERGQ
jgi:pimeloyl-ACP methyl ester carboxylesterase